jgi:hypothetical protein
LVIEKALFGNKEKIPKFAKTLIDHDDYLGEILDTTKLLQVMVKFSTLDTSFDQIAELKGVYNPNLDSNNASLSVLI